MHCSDSENKLSKGLSFDTISSTGPNGGEHMSSYDEFSVLNRFSRAIAIIHYKPTEEDCAVIDKDQMYLCDSGGKFPGYNARDSPD